MNCLNVGYLESREGVSSHIICISQPLLGASVSPAVANQEAGVRCDTLRNHAEGECGQRGPGR